MKTITIAIDVPEDRLIDDLEATDFATIVSQSPTALELIKRLPGDDKTWHPSSVTAEIGCSVRIVKEKNNEE